jgi:ribonuclease Z
LKPRLHAQLLNPPFDDPGLFVEILWERRALLFDLGDLRKIRPAKLLKVSHAFVSHTHIDHFIGFDSLLRTMLNREKSLKVFGPPGFLDNVQGKLAGYTWNLTAEYPFSVEAVEVHPDHLSTQTFQCQERFAPGERHEQPFNGILAEDPQMQVRAVHLDHLIPCLGFSLQERWHINIHKDRLAQSGLAVGPWLKDLKDALWRGEREDFPLRAGPRGEMKERELTLGELRKMVSITPGQKIAYVADCRYSEGNRSKIIELASGADLFFCEGAFADQDRERAEERAHLTARQAGELAREAGAKKLILFHFSPRYEKEGDALAREAEEAFRG